jgi:hypothetical protein
MSLRIHPLPVAVLAAFGAVNIACCTLGYGTDRDSLRVITSAQAILHGHYQRSRSFGFPLHEAIAAALDPLGGLFAVNAAALAAALAGIAAAARLAGPRAAAVATCLAACPILLVNASVAVDFAFDFATCMALLSVADSVTRHGMTRTRSVLGFALALAALLLRPDNLLAVVSICLATLWRDRRAGLALLAAAVLAGLLAAAIYLGLNGTGMLATGVTTTRPLAARLARAAVCLAAAVGPGGALLALLLPWRRVAAAPAPALAAMLAWALYLPRFAVLPDQLDYLIIPVTFTILAGLIAAPPRLVWPAAALVALPAFITVSLFTRAPDGALLFHPALQQGALAQEIAARRFAAAMDTPPVLDFIARALPQQTATGLHAASFMPGETNPRGDLILGAAQLYRVRQTGQDLSRLATVPRRFFRDIWACDAELGPGIGWRGLEPPIAATVLERAAHGPGLNCWLAARDSDAGM